MKRKYMIKRRMDSYYWTGNGWSPDLKDMKLYDYDKDMPSEVNIGYECIAKKVDMSYQIWGETEATIERF